MESSLGIKQYLHRSQELRKEREMKKNLVALLLVLAVVSVGLFAVPSDPGDVSFKVKTTVEPLNMMKLTVAQFTGTTATALTGADELAEYHIVSASGAQGSFSGWISTLSNHRLGYKVDMTATAMKSQYEPGGTSGEAAYINYTVKVDNSESKKIVTNGATVLDAVTVIDVGPLTEVASQSLKITLDVDAVSFAAAVEGVYIGEVSFDFIAN